MGSDSGYSGNDSDQSVYDYDQNSPSSSPSPSPSPSPNLSPSPSVEPPSVPNPSSIPSSPKEPEASSPAKKGRTKSIPTTGPHFWMRKRKEEEERKRKEEEEIRRKAEEEKARKGKAVAESGSKRKATEEGVVSEPKSQKELRPLPRRETSERMAGWCIDKKFAHGRIVSIAEIDQEGWHLGPLFAEQGWESCLEIEEDAYPHLIKTFYASATFDKEEARIVASVKGECIRLDKEVLSEILETKAEAAVFYDEENWFELYGSYEDVLDTVFIGGRFSKNANDLTAVGKIIHNLTCHFILPRGGNTQFITDPDLVVLFHVMKSIPLSLPHLILRHMIKALESTRKDYALPYGMLLTRIFKFFGVNLKGEVSVAVKEAINARSLKPMKLDQRLAEEKRAQKKKGPMEEGPAEKKKKNGKKVSAKVGASVEKPAKKAKKAAQKPEPSQKAVEKKKAPEVSKAKRFEKVIEFKEAEESEVLQLSKRRKSYRLMTQWKGPSAEPVQMELSSDESPEKAEEATQKAAPTASPSAPSVEAKSQEEVVASILQDLGQNLNSPEASHDHPTASVPSTARLHTPSPVSSSHTVPIPTPHSTPTSPILPPPIFDHTAEPAQKAPPSEAAPGPSQAPSSPSKSELAKDIKALRKENKALRKQLLTVHSGQKVLHESIQALTDRFLNYEDWIVQKMENEVLPENTLRREHEPFPPFPKFPSSPSSSTPSSSSSD